MCSDLSAVGVFNIVKLSSDKSVKASIDDAKHYGCHDLRQT